MQKIPVGRTIAFAYLFLFTHIGTIIGIAWLPAVISSAANYLFRLYAATHRSELEAGDPQVGGVYFVLAIAASLVMLYASSVVAIAITRLVMGQSFRGVILYIAIGRVEFRLFAANLRYFVGALTLLVLAGLISALAFFLAGVPLDTLGTVEPSAATILASLIAWVVMLYALVTIVRMGFLLPAVVVNEENAGLRRSHDLTQGTIWRVLIVMLALGAPILLLVFAGEAFLLNSALGADVGTIDPKEFFERAAQAMEDKLLVWHIFSAVVFILGSGLIYSGAAFAYRSLVPDRMKPPEPGV